LQQKDESHIVSAVTGVGIVRNRRLTAAREDAGSTSPRSRHMDDVREYWYYAIGLALVVAVVALA